VASGTALDVIVQEGPVRTAMLIDFETNAAVLNYDLDVKRGGIETKERRAQAHENVHVYSKDRIEDELEAEGVFDKEFLLTQEWAMYWVTDEAIRIKADLIVIDTVRSGHPVAENDNPEVEAMFAKFKKLARRANAAVVVLHHINKYADNGVRAGDDTLWMFAGCGAWQGKPDLSLHLFPVEENGKSGVKVMPGKYKYKSPDTSKRLPAERVYRIHEVTRQFVYDYDLAYAEWQAGQTIDDEVFRFIEESQPGDTDKGVKTASIVEALSDENVEGRSRQRINDSLSSLLDRKRIVKVGRGFYRTNPQGGQVTAVAKI
jgi:hypothetical protein